MAGSDRSQNRRSGGTSQQQGHSRGSNYEGGANYESNRRSATYQQEKQGSRGSGNVYNNGSNGVKGREGSNGSSRGPSQNNNNNYDGNSNGKGLNPRKRDLSKGDSREDRYSDEPRNKIPNLGSSVNSIPVNSRLSNGSNKNNNQSSYNNKEQNRNYKGRNNDRVRDFDRERDYDNDRKRDIRLNDSRDRDWDNKRDNRNSRNSKNDNNNNNNISLNDNSNSSTRNRNISDNSRNNNRNNNNRSFRYDNDKYDSSSNNISVNDNNKNKRTDLNTKQYNNKSEHHNQRQQPQQQQHQNQPQSQLKKPHTTAPIRKQEILLADYFKGVNNIPIEELENIPKSLQFFKLYSKKNENIEDDKDQVTNYDVEDFLKINQLLESTTNNYIKEIKNKKFGFKNVSKFNEQEINKFKMDVTRKTLGTCGRIKSLLILRMYYIQIISIISYKISRDNDASKKIYGYLLTLLNDKTSKTEDEEQDMNYINKFIIDDLKGDFLEDNHILSFKQFSLLIQSILNEIIQLDNNIIEEDLNINKELNVNSIFRFYKLKDEIVLKLLTNVELSEEEIGSNIYKNELIEKLVNSVKTIEDNLTYEIIKLTSERRILMTSVIDYKNKTSNEKNRMDKVILELQNVNYEKLQLVKEIKDCKSMDNHIYQNLQLLPISDFYNTDIGKKHLQFKIKPVDTETNDEIDEIADIEMPEEVYKEESTEETEILNIEGSAEEMEEENEGESENEDVDDEEQGAVEGEEEEGESMSVQEKIVTEPEENEAEKDTEKNEVAVEQDEEDEVEEEIEEEDESDMEDQVSISSEITAEEKEKHAIMILRLEEELEARTNLMNKLNELKDRRNVINKKNENLLNGAESTNNELKNVFKSIQNIQNKFKLNNNNTKDKDANKDLKSKDLNTNKKDSPISNKRNHRHYYRR